MLIVTKPVAQSYESSHASEIVLYAVSDVFDPHALSMCHMPVDQKHHLLHTGQFHWHEMTHNSELLVW